MTGTEETSPSEKSLRDQSLSTFLLLWLFHQWWISIIRQLDFLLLAVPSGLIFFILSCVPSRFFRVCFSAGSVFTRPYALALFFLFYHRRPVRFHLDGSVRRLPPPFLRLLKQTPLVYYLLPVFFFVFVKLFQKSKSTLFDFYEFGLFFAIKHCLIDCAI